MTGWRAALEDARRARVRSVAEQVWDGHFARAVTTGLRSRRTSSAAVAIAYTRTEDQYGKRPDTKEKP